MKQQLNEIKRLQELAGIMPEGRDASTWDKAKLNSELKSLSIGAQEAGDIDDSMAWDIADSWLAENPGVEKAIQKFYPSVTDFQGFVANYIA